MYDLFACEADASTFVVLERGENPIDKLPHHSRIMLGPLEFWGSLPDEFRVAEKLGVKPEKLSAAIQQNGYLIYRRPRSQGPGD